MNREACLAHRDPTKDVEYADAAATRRQDRVEMRLNFN
jgi:hypothetical protein